jgi:hypothetical protein
MKKVRLFICRTLVKVCNWILPEGAEAVIPPIEGYTPSKVGMSLRYTDNVITKLTDDMEGNNKKARQFVIDDAKSNISNSIFNALVEKKMIQFKVSYPKKGEINVSGELKVYVPKE